MNLKDRADEVLTIQKDAIQKLETTASWIKSIELIGSVTKNYGRIITTGMGKAGIIAQKMSATLSSIGIPSVFIHPAEALHGDLGRIASNDLIIVFSHSGSTTEVGRMITHLHALNDHKNIVIIISGHDNPLIPHNHVVCYGEVKESSVVKKVPSTSTTVMLIIADVLAITAAEALGFNDEWFKQRHPGGEIGKIYEKNNNN